MPEEPKPLYMKVSLGTIDDLGVKLYSGFPAAIAELVANAWDADAERVDIITPNGKIIIKDDGHGMNRDDIQNKYLTVGYRRRDHGEKKTPKHERNVMGRKGIGRLALFAIANHIKVYSVKNGEKIGLELSYSEIEAAIDEGEDYYPEEIEPNEMDIACGTRIELTDFRHKPKGLSVRLGAHTLAEQILKYMRAVSKELRTAKKKDNVEGIIIVERPPWDDDEQIKKGERALREEDIRLTTYQEIISQAMNQYQDYINMQRDARDKIRMIDRILESIK